MRDILFALAAIFVLVLWAEQYGEHRIQTKWNDETIRLETIANEAIKRNEENLNALNLQHKKDIELAKSQAGRAAIAAWLKSRGLLPDGSPVQPRCDGDKAESPEVPDGGPDPEPVIGIGIEEFAADCAKGALMNMDWREWAIREGLEAE